MAREYDLKPAPSDLADAAGVGATSINRRQFLRYGFNTAAGVLTASLGMLGFAAILLPPGGGGGGDAGGGGGGEAAKEEEVEEEEEDMGFDLFD